LRLRDGVLGDTCPTCDGPMTERARFERLALPHMDAAYNLAFWLLHHRADAEDGDKEPSDKLLHYLTWDELIHTSYFSVAQFRKLVAYALSQQKGFRARPAFAQDPDFVRVTQWYGAITGVQR